MKCPYCNREMQKGVLSGNGRRNVIWKPGEKQAGFMDRLNGTGELKAAEYCLMSFMIEAEYCAACKKMIIDTEISE